MKKKKLNLGSGHDYRSEYINLDLYNKADVKHDMNIFPYPFKENTFQEVACINMLEHLDAPVRVMEEIWRIAKPGGIVIIKAPFYNSYDSVLDITHIRFFTYDSLNFCFKKNTIFTTARYELLDFDFTTNYFIPKVLARPLSLILGNITNTLYWKLKVIK